MSGVMRLVKPVPVRRRDPVRPRRGLPGLRVVGLERVVRRVATPQTSTTTGKTIGRRFVCSYR
jgi:hypothetical protein